MTYNSLSRAETRIIEQTKKEGAELERRETEQGLRRRGGRGRAIVFFVVAFILLAVGLRFLYGWAAQQ